MKLRRSSKSAVSVAVALTAMTSAKTMPLVDCPKGLVGRVLRLEGDDDFNNRLREMGLCESAEVSVLQANGSILCQVQGSRFGLSRLAAQAVIVGEIA